jgi:hypothetical protein
MSLHSTCDFGHLLSLLMVRLSNNRSGMETNRITQWIDMSTPGLGRRQERPIADRQSFVRNRHIAGDGSFTELRYRRSAERSERQGIVGHKRAFAGHPRR